MRISDWSSDVCSSDLARWGAEPHVHTDLAFTQPVIPAKRATASASRDPGAGARALALDPRVKPEGDNQGQRRRWCDGIEAAMLKPPRSLERLLRPETIAVFGGGPAAAVIAQCDRMGFEIGRAP